MDVCAEWLFAGVGGRKCVSRWKAKGLWRGVLKGWAGPCGSTEFDAGLSGCRL